MEVKNLKPIKMNNQKVGSIDISEIKELYQDVKGKKVRIDFTKRPIEQIVNEGKAMLASKDNEIEFIETSFKNVYNEQERQIKSLRESLEFAKETKDEYFDRILKFDKTLKRQYDEKNDLKRKLSVSENTGKVLESKVKELKDNCNTYVSKIQEQHREIEELRIIAKDLDDYVMSFSKERESLNLEIKNERHNKYLVMGAAVIAFIGFLIAWYL